LESTRILTVGSESCLLAARNVILESAGYTTVMASSLTEAAKAFQRSDFHLVLLDNSFPAKDHDRLVCLIRASGSRIPIISIVEQRSHRNPFADEIVESAPDKLRTGIRNALAKSRMVAFQSL
jgi:CheY-like chemotaxis protein